MATRLPLRWAGSLGGMTDMPRKYESSGTEPDDGSIRVGTGGGGGGGAQQGHRPPKDPKLPKKPTPPKGAKSSKGA